MQPYTDGVTLSSDEWDMVTRVLRDARTALAADGPCELLADALRELRRDIDALDLMHHELLPAISERWVQRIRAEREA